jgi:hypothetical protein
MKHALTLSLLMLLLPLSSLAEEVTLKGGIKWDEERARTYALKHLNPEIDTAHFQAVDPIYRQNSLLPHELPETLRQAFRQVTFFNSGDYSVVYDGENIVHYYTQQGDLLKVSICSTPFGPETDYSSYPRKCVEYGYPEGRIITVSMDVSPKESFVFSPSGELKNHWVGEQCFDDCGNEILKRQQ